jgi:hypothetical protein
MGAHGRTGTLLACLLVLQGSGAQEAIRLVRKSHCFNAIETSSQEIFVHRFYNDLHGIDVRTYGNEYPNRKPTAVTEIHDVDEATADIIKDTVKAFFEEKERMVGQPDVVTVNKNVGWEADDRWYDELDDVRFPQVESARYDDADAYEEWQRLNSAELARIAVEDKDTYTRYVGDRLDCADGWCRDPQECDAAGDCWIRAVWRQIDD